MDDMRLRLGEQVNTFTAQATQVDKWDRQLIERRDRTLQLRQTAKRLQQGAASVNAELEAILRRQDEMHAALSELERKVEDESCRPHTNLSSERQQAYEVVDELDRQLCEMRESLTHSVEQLNMRRQGSSQYPAARQLNQLVEVLDVHHNAFKWVDKQSAALDETLRQVDLLLSDPHTVGQIGARHAAPMHD